MRTGYRSRQVRLDRWMSRHSWKSDKYRKMAKDAIEHQEKVLRDIQRLKGKIRGDEVFEKCVQFNGCHKSKFGLFLRDATRRCKGRNVN